MGVRLWSSPSEPDPSSGKSASGAREDAAVAHWLELLRNGTAVEQSVARTELGLILERRGKLDEAAEAFYSNVKARVRDPRSYERLAIISRQRGDHPYAERVLQTMVAVLGPDGERPVRGTTSQPDGYPLAQVATAMGLAVLAVLAAIGVMAALVWALPSASGCADAAKRFPEWRDPEGAIQRATAESFRARGVNPYVANPVVRMFVAAHAVPPDDAVAGWMAHSLYWSQKGDASQLMSLAAYVERQGGIRSGLGSLVRPDYLGPVLTREQWAEMQGWSRSTCPGALMRNPDNTRLVRLMAKSVGDVAWLTVR